MKITKIEHFLPGFGKLVLPIYDKVVKDTISKFEAAGEINRLKNLDHLGFLRREFYGAHHTRWEYVFLQLYLSDFIRAKAKGTGLSRDIKVGKTKYGSGSSLIQCLALLLNSGHLSGTFITERYLLWRLYRLSIWRKNFIALLPTQQKPIFEEVLEKGDWHRFFMLIAAYRLKSFKLNFDWLSLFQFYQKPPKNNIALSRLFSKFRLLRRLAYVYLDQFYVTGTSNINLPSILVRATTDTNFAKSLILQSGPIGANLRFFNRELTERVYSSKQASYATMEGLGGIKRLFKEKKLKGNNIKDMKNTLKTLAKPNIIDGIPYKKEKPILIRAMLTPNIDYGLASNPLELYHQLRSRVGKRGYHYLTLNPPYLGKTYVDLHINKDMQTIPRSVLALTRILAQGKFSGISLKATRRFMKAKPQVDRVFMKEHRIACYHFLKDLLLYSFNNLSDVRSAVVDDIAIHPGPAIISRSLIHLKETIDRISKVSIPRAIDCTDEFRALSESIEYFQQLEKPLYWGVFCGPIEFFFKVPISASPQAEIDSIIIGFFKTKISYTFIEARKRKRNRPKQLLKILKNKIEKIKPRGSPTISSIEISPSVVARCLSWDYDISKSRIKRVTE